MTHCLIDTGPIVAYLVSGDPAHAPVVEWFQRFSGRLVTTTAVVTESMHFLGVAPNGPAHLTDLLAATRVRVVGLDRIADLRAATTLMSRYCDVPMDYADATLLLVADRLGIDAIATLDRRGFAAYRTPGGRPLKLALG